MSSPRDSHSGGRPRSREASPLFLRVQSMAKRRGLKLNEVASAAGIRLATIYELHDPRVSTARAIATALGVSLERLTRVEPEQPRKRAAR